MNAQKVDVLAAMEEADQRLSDEGWNIKSRQSLKDARAAVDELIEAARRAEVSFNTVEACYRRNPGNFMVAMRELDADVVPLRAALANIGSTP